MMKLEHPDEKEIEEMANQMIEHMRAKQELRTNASCSTPNPQEDSSSETTEDPTEMLYETSNLEVNQIVGDDASVVGRFGWVTLEETQIPYIVRRNEMYCSVRMLEMTVFNKYFSFLNRNIYHNCSHVQSYYITDAECKLLDTINLQHCDGHFGGRFAPTDLIVRWSDVVRFFRFLHFCCATVQDCKNRPLDRCGFVSIGGLSYMPYVISNTTQYVPTFYLEGQTELFKDETKKISGWDLLYLKFCCKVQDLHRDLYDGDTCLVVSADDLRAYYVPETPFDFSWPEFDTRMLRNVDQQAQWGQWFRKPLEQPWIDGANANQVQDVEVLQLNCGPRPGYLTQPTGAMSMGEASAPPLTPIPQQQSHPTYSRHIISPPPPLIEASQLSQSTVAYSTAQPTTSNYIMTEEPNVAQSGGSTIAPQQLQQDPQLLMPLHQINLDLASNSPPRSRYRLPADVAVSNSSLVSNVSIPLAAGTNSQTPAVMYQSRTYQQLVYNQSQQNPLNMTLNTAEQRGLSQISTSDIQQPFRMQDFSIGKIMIPCINQNPFVYDELLVAIPDLLKYMFNIISVQSCQQVLNMLMMLNIHIYRGSLPQMSVLLQNGRCQTVYENLPLVAIQDILKYISAIRFVIEEALASQVRSPNPANLQ